MNVQLLSSLTGQSDSAKNNLDGNISRKTQKTLKSVQNQIVNPKQWFQTRGEAPRASIVVTHGLNNNASLLDPLCTALSEHGFAVLRLMLRGHYSGSATLKEVQASDWIEDVRSAHDEARGRYSTLPTFGLGYSLGALALTAAVQKHQCAFRRFGFVAPPFALQPSAKLIRLLLPLARTGLSLPSLTPQQFRVASSTPLTAYKALWELIASLKARKINSTVAKVRTKIIVDPEDEFVSLNGLRCWKEDAYLENWELVPISADPKSAAFRRHLLIAPDYAGKAAWQQLTAELIQFFSRK